MGAEVKIVEALKPVVEASGLEIWDVERSGASLRVLVERPGGVDLESLAALSRALSELLDQRDDLAPAGHYELDVSSPGLERKLRYPEHFARCIGQEVAVKTFAAIEGRRRFEGVLSAASLDEVSISGRSDNGSPVRFRLPLSVIERAHTVFRWGSSAKVVKPKKVRKHSSAPGARTVQVDAEAAAASKEAG